MSLGLISRCGEGHFWTPGWEARCRGQDTMALDFLGRVWPTGGSLGYMGSGYQSWFYQELCKIFWWPPNALEENLAPSTYVSG